MKRKPTLVEALLPIVFLIVIIAVGILKYGADPQIPLLMATIVAAALGKYLGYTWSEMEKGIVETIFASNTSYPNTDDYWGNNRNLDCGGDSSHDDILRFTNHLAGIFLLASTVLCSIVSLATGSSWTTAGTVGIALLGVGEVLGIPTALTAGAIISGAYFGDKLSPLSDTTNLAAAVSGTTLFEHIRNMMKTTIPVYCIALALYTGIGLRYLGRELNTGEIYKLLHVLEQEFVIHPILLLPPILVILMVALKTPAVPGLTLGGVLGAVFAFIIQHKDFGAILEASQYGYQATTGYELADKLLSRGGLQSMMFTVSLIIVAMAFGGVVEKIKVLETIEERLITFTKTTGSLVLTTVLSCIFCNATLPEQYLSILIPGRMFKDRYRKKGLDPRVLSRILEDSGTMSSALIPWNTCGAFMYATLGVYPFAYLPFAFLMY
ncbi:Na+/H+ antiporter NhaC [Fusobacterium necrophorum subsp. funduliforme 1_1_36S]|nr:Na+/H+ antiporter NhaC [Fusobacterium necrophorum subsp. funduliforme 1_1_36S]